MPNELIIWSKVREGDIKTFEELFRRYYTPLCWYAASITGSVQAGEEIVEELFYVLWKNREKLQVFHSIKSYLYRAVRNEALQYCEHREVRERYVAAIGARSEWESLADPQREMEYKELRNLIQRTLGQLPLRRQQIFRMHRVQGMKYADIALALSLSVKTVEAEMTKVLRRLRKEIDDYIRTR